MNLLQIGLTAKNFTYPKGSLGIVDEPIPKKGVKIYDPTKHGLNPLPMQYREAREFAAAVFPDKDLMTCRNGKRALARLVMNAALCPVIYGVKDRKKRTPNKRGQSDAGAERRCSTCPQALGGVLP